MALVVVLAGICAGLMVLITNILPSLVDGNLITEFSKIIEVLSYGFYFVPITTFVCCLGVIILINKSHLIWGIFTWIIRRIPGQG